MIVPLAISWGYGEYDLNGFLYSSSFCILLGLPLWYFTRYKQSLTNRDGFAIVTFSWITTAIVGALPFYFSGSIPNITDAFFESMSGVTTTGATILGNRITMPHLTYGIESLPKGILFWRSFLQWIGGMGIIVFYIAILPLLGVGGVQLFKAEAPGPVSDKIKPRVRETAKFLWIVYVGITLIQIIVLRLAGMETFDSICHAFATMPTGGFSTKNASIAYFDSSLIHYIIIFFMFIAGINFSLHFRLINGDFKAYIKDAEFRVYLFIIVFITTIIFLSLSFQNNVFSSQGLRESLFNTVAILTSTGFVLGDYEVWPIFVQLLLLTLMFIGGMGGSTTGGMKVIRILLLVKYAVLETRRMLHSRALIPVKIGRQTINEDVVRNTLGFFLFFMSAFILSTILLSTMGLDLETSIGAAASAMGNI
ncbi:MAG: potassium transporter, partial [Candidatus Marinimicrobia bacterium]|nr:potassium transporter [Candidatus Neomarinimicrobiota bacterium]